VDERVNPMGQVGGVRTTKVDAGRGRGKARTNSYESGQFMVKGRKKVKHEQREGNTRVGKVAVAAARGGNYLAKHISSLAVGKTRRRGLPGVVQKGARRCSDRKGRADSKEMGEKRRESSEPRGRNCGKVRTYRAIDEERQLRMRRKALSRSDAVGKERLCPRRDLAGSNLVQKGRSRLKNIGWDP